MRWYMPRLKTSTRQDVVEPVDDQAGETVSLGVEDAVGVGLGIQAEHLDAEIDGPVDLLLPERQSGRLGLAREHPQR